jgi:hypothetical protein
MKQHCTATAAGIQARTARRQQLHLTHTNQVWYYAVAAPGQLHAATATYPEVSKRCHMLLLLPLTILLLLLAFLLLLLLQRQAAVTLTTSSFTP